MSHVQISNLNPAGSDLFAGEDSFLTEIQNTEATQIHGGTVGHFFSNKRKNKGGSSKSSKSGKGYKGGSSKSGSKRKGGFFGSYCY